MHNCLWVALQRRKAARPPQTAHDNNHQHRSQHHADGAIDVRALPAQAAQLRHPRGHSRQAPAEAVLDALQQLTAQHAARARRVRNVPRHAEDRRAEHIRRKGAQRKRRPTAVEQHGEVEAREAAERRKDERKDDGAAPGIMRRENGEEYGTEPAAPAEQHGELVEHAAAEAERDRRRVRLERGAKVHARHIRADGEADRLDDNGEQRHEGVAAVAVRRCQPVQVRADHVVGQREEDVADKRGEAGEAAAEAGGEANVQRNRLLRREVRRLGRREVDRGALLVVAVRLGGARTPQQLVVRGRAPPFVPEQLAVLGQEAHDEAAANVGPQRREDGGRAGVRRQVGEADAREGAEQGEEDEVGWRVELRGEARDLDRVLRLFLGWRVLLLLLLCCLATSNVVEGVAGRAAHFLVEVLVAVGDVVGRRVVAVGRGGGALARSGNAVRGHG